MPAPTIAECRALIGPDADRMTDAEVQALTDQCMAAARALIAIRDASDRAGDTPRARRSTR